MSFGNGIYTLVNNSNGSSQLVRLESASSNQGVVFVSADDQNICAGLRTPRVVRKSFAVPNRQIQLVSSAHASNANCIHGQTAQFVPVVTAGDPQVYAISSDDTSMFVGASGMPNRQVQLVATTPTNISVTNAATAQVRPMLTAVPNEPNVYAISSEETGMLMGTANCNVNGLTGARVQVNPNGAGRVVQWVIQG